MTSEVPSYGRSVYRKIQLTLLVAGSLVLLGARPAFGDAVTWYVDVNFQNGGAATGSFVYNADSNSISNIDITSPFGTFTAVASTFPLRPTELVFVENGTLTFGVLQNALVLSPEGAGLTDAGGVVANNALLSMFGAICDNACDGVTSGDVDGGL